MCPPLRQAIRQHYRRDESECMRQLMAEMAPTPYDPTAVNNLARQLVKAVRQQHATAGNIAHLMHEFSLSSQEGIALMCLAEALLRIPDSQTADHLIRDKISRGDWHAHLGHSASLFVNAASWGLMLTGKLVGTHDHGALGNTLSQLLARGGEPLIRRGVDFAIRLLGQKFVMGENITAALKRADADEKRGYSHSFDMLGEAALTAADAERYTDAYEQAIHAIGRASAGRGVIAGPGISIKLSALHPRYTRSQQQRVANELQPRLKGLLLLAKQYDIGINIDAEEADRLELSLDLFENLAADRDLAGWHGLGFVIQAYQKRCPSVIDLLINLARRTGHRLMLRLVKGAYWDSEIKRSQIDGLEDYPVYTRKAHTDLAYLACARRLLAAPDAIYPQFATHNAHTLAAVVHMARAQGIDDYEFQCLHGMGESLYDQVVAPDHLGKRCRIYAPVGNHQTLLPYLVRRLLENGANSSFVNRIVDTAISIEQLVEEPLTTIRYSGDLRHPAIPLPAALYGSQRRNSAGLDLSDEYQITELAKQLGDLADLHWQAWPLVPGGDSSTCLTRSIKNPARQDESVGTVSESSPELIELALRNADQASHTWHATAPSERATSLLRAADLLQENRYRIISLCIREAGKTWPNAIGELREAVDFCRYYAQQLLADGDGEAAPEPGPVACISPWNFPLAIFIGEVSAALAAGSPVLAKPAEQTPLLAHLAVSLLHQAGIPPQVLQLLPGRGETVGAQLTADARIRGVVFTGSIEVARQIQHDIARRPGVRLIAETGGLNAMIVDSSALPEQVVQDVLLSGFDSAGQRCSALRVLCLQDDIAGPVLHMLRAAMQELNIAAPDQLATDIGPVIDTEAQTRLLMHIERMHQQGHPVYRHAFPTACAAGCFVAPTLIEIDRFDDLQHEVFGPVVHVLRFAANQLPELVATINASGYGLTLGLHSRIDETIQHVCEHAHIGNIYINRNMVGAVVGVQPFGGEGLSGTGPKAGGPLYLHYLAGKLRVIPEQLGAKPSDHLPTALRALADAAAGSGQSGLADLCREFGRQSLLGIQLSLPGPTGERNSLFFAPRGRLLCLSEGWPELAIQLAATFATGNRAVVIDQPRIHEWIDRQPVAVRSEIDFCPADDYADLAGVLSSQSDNTALNQKLAETKGVLIPLFIATDTPPHYPLYRLVTERVITHNTAAAGGNTALMSLAP